MQVGGEVVARGTGVEVGAGVLDDGQLAGRFSGTPYGTHEVGRLGLEIGYPGPGEEGEAGEPVPAELGFPCWHAEQAGGGAVPAGEQWGQVTTVEVGVGVADQDTA